MSYDLHDTIVAIASAPGGAARGVVRLSGPGVQDCLAACFAAADGEGDAWMSASAATRVVGAVRVAGDANSPPLEVPGALFFWPDAELYAAAGGGVFLRGVAAVVGGDRRGVLPARRTRAAEPGEFTMRAFLAGRIDLTQAEAVLGVVDARTRDDLDGALAQLAGGLSRPLHELREQLLGTLAEVEAGLDFPDERLETAARDALAARLAAAEATVAAACGQLAARERAEDVGRVVLTGPPNVGKSSLFNALVARFGVDRRVRSIVSQTPGATRDYVAARLDLGGAICELIDAAGDDAVRGEELHDAAQAAAAGQRRGADLRLRCVAAGTAQSQVADRDDASELTVMTKIDLARLSAPSAATGGVACSSATGAGLHELAGEIRRRLADQSTNAGANAGAAATAARCGGILRDAGEALASAQRQCEAGDDELLAAELRFALGAIGEAVGAVCADDVLDRVFSQFCIGK